MLARCYFEELKIDCAIDQLKPSLKSLDAIFVFCYLKSVLVENAGPQRAFTLLITHRDAQQHTNMPNIKN